MPGKLIIAGLSVAAAMPVAAWIARGQFSEPVDESMRFSSAGPGADAAARAPVAGSMPSVQPQRAATRRSLGTVDPSPARQAKVSESPTDSAVTDAVKAGSGGETLYLTIVGDQTYMSRGLVDDGPPSLTELRAGRLSASSGGTAASASVSYDSRRMNVVTTQTPRQATSSRPIGTGSRSRTQANSGQSADASLKSPGQPAGDVDQPGLPADINRPWVDDRPWPNAGCPWTLPEGTSQQQANTLSAQYGCRYLASCSFATQQCTFYYQGSS